VAGFPGLSVIALALLTLTVLRFRIYTIFNSNKLTIMK
jgi:hypothetical protein